MAVPFRNKGYDPETVVFLQQCLDIATEAACRLTGSLPSEDLRQRLAIALMEGAEADLSNQDELIDFAVKSLPEFRKRLAN
ncbi:MAG: hypothetical protein K0R27_331 [Xanthobacteraceae bacterium]|jgi:hypothetical protein|nr:hypothetical protein [Xanthobacteraceae bacterium]